MKKAEGKKRNSMSETDWNDEQFEEWIRERFKKEAEDIEKSTEYISTKEEDEAIETKFQSLMEKVKEQGLDVDFFKTEEERAGVCLLPVKKTRSRWKRKAVQWSAVAAVTVLGIFGVSMSSEANRAYFMKEVHRVFGNDVNTEIDNTRTKKSDRTEEIAREEIENSLHVAVPRFFYLPEKLLYQGYDIDNQSNIAVIQYLYEGQRIYFNIFANTEEAAVSSQNDRGKRILSINSELTATLDTELWEILEEGDLVPTYTLKWDYKNTYYEFFGKIPKEEIERIAKEIMY